MRWPVKKLILSVGVLFNSCRPCSDKGTIGEKDTSDRMEMGCQSVAVRETHAFLELECRRADKKGEKLSRTIRTFSKDIYALTS
jgi:hypothetical protein